MTPANSIVLLALVYAQKYILAFESVERVQIEALLYSESCIYEIVLNFRHDHCAKLHGQSQRTFRSRGRD